MSSKDCEISTYQEHEYVDMMKDTSNLIAREKAESLGEVMTAFKESAQLANEVEFWKWMGAKSPTTSSTGGLILALQRAMLLLAPQGDVASTFTGPL